MMRHVRSQNWAQYFGAQSPCHSRSRTWFVVIYVSVLLFYAITARATHPADLDRDFFLSTQEVGAYYSSFSGGPEEIKAEPNWAQAHFIWTHGGAYHEDSRLPTPYGWLPSQAPDQFASLAKRYVRCLETVTIHGLPEDSTHIAARFRIADSAGEWIGMDVTAIGNEIMVTMPYIPSLWLDSRVLEAEIDSDGSTYILGRFELQPIHTTQWNYLAALRASQESLTSIANFDIQSALEQIRNNEAIPQPIETISYFYLLADWNADAYEALLADPEPETEIVLQILDELIALEFEQLEAAVVLRRERAPPIVASRLLNDASDLSTTRASQRSLEEYTSLTNMGTRVDANDDWLRCEPINGYSISASVRDLVTKSRDRCKIEEKEKTLEEQVGRKAIEKLPDIAKKLAKKVGVKDFARTVPGLGQAISIPLMLYDFLQEWNKGTLPKKVDRLETQVVRREGGAPYNHSFFLEDSPNGDTCPQYSFALTMDVTSEGFFLAKFLLDSKIPNPEDSLVVLIANDDRLTRIAKKLGSWRTSAIEKIHGRIKDYDFEAKCTWRNIAVPSSLQSDGNSMSTFELEQLPGAFAVKPTSPGNYFEPCAVGSGSVNIRLNFVDTYKDTRPFPCLEPYKQRFDSEVRPITIDVSPIVVNVQDVGRPIQLVATIHDSYESETARWVLRDNTGKIVGVINTTATAPAVPPGDLPGPTEHKLSVDPPDDFSVYPIRVEVVSQAKGCVRKKDPTQRKGSSELHYNKQVFTIAPGRGCFPLGESIVLEAITETGDPVSNLSWEVLEDDFLGGGGSSIEKTGPMTANVTLGVEPKAEIVVKATGADGFSSYAYLSAGPCIDWVSKYAQYPKSLFENPILDMEYHSPATTLTIGYDGFAPRNFAIPGVNPLFPKNQLNGVPAIFASGSSKVTPIENLPTIDNSARRIRALYEGVFLALSDSGSPSPVMQMDGEVGGTFFSEGSPGASLGASGVAYLIPGFEAGAFLEFDDNTYTLRFLLEVGDHVLDFERVTAIWSSDNGILKETTRSQVPNTPSWNYRAVVEYDRSETAPSIRLNLSGEIQNSDSSWSYRSDALTTYNMIELQGESIFKAKLSEEAWAICGGFGGPPTDLDRVLDGCCGYFELSGFERTRGVARQEAVNAYRGAVLGGVEAEDVGGSLLQIFGSSDIELTYCEELRRLEGVIERGDIEDPEDDPETPENPNAIETPSQLENYFFSTDIDLDTGNMRASLPPNALLNLVSSQTPSVVLYDDILHYPYQPLDGGPQLGQFVNRVLTTSHPLAGAQELNYLGQTVRLVCAIQLSPSIPQGLLVEREYNASRLIDYWAYDPEKSKSQGFHVLDSEDLLAIGAGDFDLDGRLDIGFVDPVGDLVFRRGLEGNSFAPAQALLAKNGPANFRAIATDVHGNVIVVSENPLIGTFQILRIEKGAAIETSSGSTGFINQPQALADFNLDGIPDLVLKSLAFQTFTVSYLDASGSSTETQTYSGLPFLAELPGPGSF